LSKRLDSVVIMARGASRRMGQPKGLLACPGSENRTFLETIASQYAALDLPMLVVTTPDLVASYAALVAGVPRCQVVGHPGGGDTAGTVEWALQEAGPDLTHLWAHPVDMPLLKTSTLQDLWQQSRRTTASCVRPSHLGVPGHPVVTPVSGLIPLRGHQVWRSAAMREVIAMSVDLGHIEKTVLVPVADLGVVKDFDTPADLDLPGNVPFAEDPDGSA